MKFLIFFLLSLYQFRGAKYLIITYDDFYNQALILAKWKHKKGVPTKVVRVSEIGNTAYAIRNYIFNAYNSWEIKPEYVLIFGGVGFVATSDQGNGYDHYYSDMTGNALPEIAVGRLPCTSTSQAEMMVQKILSFEKDVLLNPDWYIRGTTIVRRDNDPVDDSIYFRDTRMVRRFWIQYGYTKIDSLRSDQGHNAQTVINCVNEGREFVVYRGSGVENWWSPFNVDPYQTANGKKLPIVVSGTCRTVAMVAGYEYAGEAWLRAGSVSNLKGAVAFLGTTTLVTNGAYLRSAFVRGFFKRIYRDSVYILGEALKAGKKQVYDSTGNISEVRSWQLLGDPELNLWTKSPDSFLVIYPETIPPASQNIEVIVKSKTNLTPVNKARVCIMGMNDSIYVYGETNSQGYISLFIPEPSPFCTLYLTVTKFNYLPYEGNIYVIDAGMPQVPEIIAPFNFVRVPDLKPTLFFYSIDPNNDLIEYKVLWDEDVNFASPDSWITEPYPSGEIFKFNFPHDLENGETYWWKVKCRDPFGSGYWTSYTEKRSFTCDSFLPPNTCSWYQTKGAQFNYDNFNGTKIEGDSVVLIPSGQIIFDTILFENFESGLPQSWTVIDGNNDGIKWTCGTTPDLGSYIPPNCGTQYAYYSDDDAGNGTINYNEELWSPKICIPSNIMNLKIGYSYGFQVYQSGEKYRVYMRKKVSGSWTNWYQLKIYTSSSSGQEVIDLTSHLPCDSIQFRFFYSDSTASAHWGWACAADNVVLFYSYTLQNNYGNIISTPIEFSEFSKVYPSYKWGLIYFYKSSPQDSIGIQVEYYDGNEWVLIPDSILPGNSNGIFTQEKIGEIDISSLDVSIYHTIRLKAHFYRVTSKEPSNPALCAWEVTAIHYVKSNEKENLNSFIRIYPKIFRNNLTLYLNFNDGEKMTLKIYDLNGRIVEDLSYIFKKKISKVYWGKSVKNGIYFIEFKKGNHKEIFKVIKIK